MKVVLFCGGQGTRIRDSEDIPKPMVTIGYRPILWHLMKYYSYYGHKDFILCLGYKADVIKTYFLNYNECLSNDFVLANGGKNIKLINSDIDDWNITFVDTGQLSNIGQRLKAVAEYLDGEDMFLANYSDGLTDLPLPQYIANFEKKNKVAGFLSVKPAHHSFHVVTIQNGGAVRKIQHVIKSGIWLNGGYFIFKKDIFRYIKDSEELVEEPFQRLIKEDQLYTYKYDGFWIGMDTFKEKQKLDNMNSRGEVPWQVWNTQENKSTKRTNDDKGKFRSGI